MTGPYFLSRNTRILILVLLLAININVSREIKAGVIFLDSVYNALNNVSDDGRANIRVRQGLDLQSSPSKNGNCAVCEGSHVLKDQGTLPPGTFRRGIDIGLMLDEHFLGQTYATRNFFTKRPLLIGVSLREREGTDG
jgi:hypothetical protein